MEAVRASSRLDTFRVFSTAFQIIQLSQRIVSRNMDYQMEWLRAKLKNTVKRSCSSEESESNSWGVWMQNLLIGAGLFSVVVGLR